MSDSSVLNRKADVRRLLFTHKNDAVSNLNGEDSVLFDGLVACMNNPECLECILPTIRDTLQNLSTRIDPDSLVGSLKQFLGSNLDFSFFEQGLFGLNLISKSVTRSRKAVISLLTERAIISEETFKELARLGYNEYRVGHTRDGIFYYANDYTLIPGTMRDVPEPKTQNLRHTRGEVDGISMHDRQVIVFCVCTIVAFAFYFIRSRK